MNAPPSLKPADAQPDNWADRFLPAAWLPYARLARLDRPVGTWLLLWPCWWSLALAGAQPWEQPLLYLYFALGALLMRGAGCVHNDILDRKFDGRVARTANRPLPSGALTVPQALIFQAALMLLALGILLQFNNFTIWLGLAAILPVALYPLMKRFTYWPQLTLGLVFNWGALMGWSAIHGSISLAAVLLYTAGICWTIGYDTIYAHQDKDDDALIGLKSTALLFGDRTKAMLYPFYAAALVLMVAANWRAAGGTPYLTGFIVVAAHFGWQVATLELDNSANCLRRFKSNILLGLLVFACIAVTQMGS